MCVCPPLGPVSVHEPTSQAREETKPTLDGVQAREVFLPRGAGIRVGGVASGCVFAPLCPVSVHEPMSQAREASMPPLDGVQAREVFCHAALGLGWDALL